LQPYFQKSIILTKMMDQKQQDFYQKLRSQIAQWIGKKSNQNQRWAEYILLAPDLFHLLCKLMVEAEVPPAKKIKLAAVITYFISPIDFIPEGFLGPIGYLDDIALAAYVLNDLINDVNPQVISRHWAGDGDILNLLKTILLNSDKMLGSGLWKKIR
jgi:uncharacterized membrane protein YkvA (DUF1232 family)